MQRPEFQRLPLHEQRLHAIACSCNSEWKSIMIAFCLSADMPRTSWQIMQEFASAVGEGAYVPDSSNFKAVMERSMVTYGVAVPSVSSASKSWILSDFGSEYAAPVAAHSLQWAVQHGMSLYSVLGHSASPGETLAPLNRLRILRFMRHHPDARRVTDIVDGVGIDFAVVSSHVSQLMKIGFVEFRSASLSHEGWRHTWVEGKDLEDAINDSSLTHYTGSRRRVVEHIRSIPTRNASPREISEALKMHPVTVRNILSALREKGYTTCTWVGREKHTDAMLLGKGKEFAETWLDAVEDALADGHTKEAMAMHLNDTLPIAGSAAALYLPLSKKGRMRPFEDRLADTLRFIDIYTSSKGIGPRTMEIISSTGVMCSNILHSALESKLIERETEGKGRRWRLTPAGKEKITPAGQ